MKTTRQKKGKNKLKKQNTKKHPTKKTQKHTQTPKTHEKKKGTLGSMIYLRSIPACQLFCATFRLGIPHLGKKKKETGRG